jgi:hypothetical protein
MEQVVRTDTDNVTYDTNEHYDLIFTPAERVVTTDNVNCECGDCNDCNDWISGDIVNW